MQNETFKRQHAGFQQPGLSIRAEKDGQAVYRRVKIAGNTPTHRVHSIITAMQRIGKWYWLPLVCGLMSAEGAHAVQGEEFIAAPRYSLTDRFSVNHYSGEVSLNVDTVAIGGERGLSHSIAARTNLFEYPGNRGYTDKFAAALRYKVLGEGDPTPSKPWVMSATALGDSADFLVMRNEQYASDGRNFTSNFVYEAIGDKRHTLTVEGGSRVWTKPDGTRVFFGISSAGAGWGSSASRIVYPDGYTLYLHDGTGVTTNTGFQLKYDYVNDDPGLAPEKQGRSFPPVPSEAESASAQWWSKNPKHIYAINRAIEYCDESTTAPCNLQHAWPKATFQWPGGMPRAIFIDQSVVTIENAAGGKSQLRYEAVDAAQGIEYVTPGYNMAPRLVAYTAPGASEPTVRYTYKNQIGTRATGSSGSEPYLITRAGETETAWGIMGSMFYTHNPGQWGEIFHQSGQSGGISAGVSTALPGTLQALTIDRELSIFSFEATYRNFPKVMTNYNGPSKSYGYDSRGNVKSVEYLPMIDGQSVVYEASYPTTCANPKTCNKPERIKDASGNETYYSYHAESGQIATITGPEDQNGVRPVSRYYYEQRYAYYKKNGSSVERADTPLWLLTREASCRTTATAGDACAGGPLDEVVTVYDYGPQDGSPNNLFLRGVSVTAEVGGALVTRTTCYEYDIYGHRIGETLPKGVAGGCGVSAPQQPAAYKYAKRYTPAGQLVGEISPDPDGASPLGFKATRHVYGTDGKLLRTETGELPAWPNETIPPANWNMTVLGSVHYQYDAYGRKIEQRSRDSNGATVRLIHYNYEPRGNVECKALRMNLAATTSTGACTATTGPHGQDRITRYEYNIKDQVRVEWRAWGTPQQQKYAEYTFQSMLITGLTDANGNKTEQRYDDHGRLSRRVYPSKTNRGLVNEGDYQEYRYDQNGNMKWERKRSGASFNYSYDMLNRMTAKLPGAGRSVHYRYDLRGLQLQARFDNTGGPGIGNQYDGFGRLAQTSNTLGGVSRTLTYDYDKNNNRTRITHPDGVAFSYQFDGLDRVSGVGEGGSTNDLLTLLYHPNGGRDSLLRTGGAETGYDYDAAQRIDHLIQDLAGTSNDLIAGFDFNPAGQIMRLTRSTDLYHYSGNANKTGLYVANGLNQYTSVNGATFAYDANGNLTSDGNSNYAYDAENRLISVSGANTAALEYDPLGRLFQVTVNGQTRQFLYDGDALVAEYAPSSTTPLARYVHGDRVDEPWVQYSGAGIGSSQRIYLHTDHQNSVIAHSDGLGNALNILRYDGYGIADTQNVGRFGYTGQAWLPELGLYYYKARMYSPTLGRFLQADPIGYEDQMNLYAYVGNDPLNYTDPSGMVGLPGFFIGVAIEVGVQTLVQGKTLGELDLGDVFVAGAVSAVVPGLFSAAKVGFVSTSAVVQSTKAISKLSGQSANTLNRASKIEHGIKKNVEKIINALGDMSKATAAAAGHQLLNAHGQEAAPPVTVDDTMEAFGGSDGSSAASSTTETSSSTKTSNSDNGMSGGNVKICSGMGAQKGGCN